MLWRRKWQPTPVFLPGESQGGEPGGLPSMGSHRVGHNCRDLATAESHQGSPSHDCNFPNSKNHRHYEHSQSAWDINKCLDLNVIQTQNARQFFLPFNVHPSSDVNSSILWDRYEKTIVMKLKAHFPTIWQLLLGVDADKYRMNDE